MFERMFRAIVRFSPLLLAAALQAPPVWASPLVLPFSGIGKVTPGPGFDPSSPVWPLEVLPVFTSYELASEPGWTMSASFDYSFITLTGTGTFTLADAFGNSLFGNIDTVSDPSNGPLGGFDITYTVLGGTGGFAGFIADGFSEVVLTSDPRAFPTDFTESGFIAQRVMLSAPPAPWLALLGLLILASARYQTRHRKSTP